MKIIVYADTVREARKFYHGQNGETVGHRAASDFVEPEKCDIVKYAKEYPEIKAAYEGKKKAKKKYVL